MTSDAEDLSQSSSPSPSIATSQTSETVTSLIMSVTESISNASPNSEYYLQCAVIFIGIVGTLANGFVVFVLVVSKQVMKLSNSTKLILNQLFLDGYTSLMLVVSYSVKVANIYLTSSWGYWLCMFVIGEQLIWYGLSASIFNLAVVAIERYLKVCHPVWHKNQFRPSMLYSAIAFTWISGIAMNAGLVLSTSAVVDGMCLVVVFWSSAIAQVAFGIWYFMSYYLILIVIFIYCYGRIFATVRGQNHVFPSVAPYNSGQNSQNKQTQIKVLKTMFVLTLFFAVCWLPNQVYYLLLNVQPWGLTQLTDGWYVTIFLSLFNVCANPFIYGIQSEIVRKYLRGFKGKVIRKEILQSQVLHEHHPHPQLGENFHNTLSSSMAKKNTNSQNI